MAQKRAAARRPKKRAAAPRGLSDKQQDFVREYLVDLNGRQAAIRAKYSAKTADQQAVRLLRNVKVQEAIAAAQAKRSERTEITQDRVLRELAKIGFGDIRNLFDANGGLRAVKDMDDDAAACIASIEVTSRKPKGGEEGELEEVAKVRLWDKRAALIDIGKHLGMFKDRHEHTGPEGGPLQVTHIELVAYEGPASPTE